jgi:hypothetical protein
LMAILVPVLSSAKKQATLTGCIAKTFYNHLASYHLKSSTFGFVDGHADRRKWMDNRTLEFIRRNTQDPLSHSGITLASPDNEDVQ